jgi:hypothetical protein
MDWPYKATVKFRGDEGVSHRFQYAVSAANCKEAQEQLEERFLHQEIFGYTIEDVHAATEQEAAVYALPSGCVQLLGY